jgi:O-antigen/teichoic acid export membrane protein
MRLYACAAACGLAAAWGALRSGEANAPSPTPPSSSPPFPGSASLQSALSYGWPLLAAGIVNSIVVSSDRYVLGIHLGVAGVAVYVVMVKLANLLNLLANPVNLWFPAARFRHAADPDGGQAFFPRLALWATFAYCGVGAVMWVMAPWMLTWFAPGFEWNALAGALLIGAAVSLAISPPMNVGLLSQGKTRWNFVIGSVCAVYQLASLAIWVPWLGVVGAGVATLSAQALSLALQHIGSQRTHRLHWSYLSQIGIAVCAVLLCLAARQVSSAMLLQPAQVTATLLQSALVLGGWAVLGLLLWQRTKTLATTRGTHLP